VADTQDRTKITRIKASEDAPAPKKAAAKSTQKNKVAASRPKRNFGPLGGFFGYFKGAWQELRQVHWPNRRATWGLTGAVLLFAAFFVVFITALDALFKLIFERILGS
jgi:preprotein translocase SecE subunit